MLGHFEIFFYINVADIPHSISMDDEIDTSSMSSGKKMQTHTFTKFPQPDDSDDDDGDKADVRNIIILISLYGMDWLLESWCEFMKFIKNVDMNFHSIQS